MARGADQASPPLLRTPRSLVKMGTNTGTCLFRHDSAVCVYLELQLFNLPVLDLNFADGFLDSLSQLKV